MSRRCMGCMEIFGDEFEICPHCGYIVGTHAEEAIHIEPGSLLYDRYIVGKVLGYGGFGVTYIGWDGKLEQKVAIKEYLPGEFSTRMPGQSQITVFGGDKSQQFSDGLKKFVEEAKRLAKFQNEEGIVKVFDSFEENDTAYIVMEYLDGETLTEYLKKAKTIPEDDAVAMLMPIMESLQTVHEEGILHRDIAPDNIFLTKTGEVKLIDFGASRFATTSHSRSLTVIIKPGYSPEEQYRSRGDQGPHTDVYALASTLYKMITGKTPPDAMERRAKYENQNKDILEEPHKLNKNISLNRENAILNAMNVRIEDRTADVAAFVRELNADPPVKRRYGKIKKLDLYAWPLWLKILVPTVLSVLIVFGALLVTGVISFERFTEEIVLPENVVIVPDVEGMMADKAINTLKESKLLVTTGGNIESEYIEPGKIVLQDPTGGSYFEKNGTVSLIVSSGKGVESPENGVATVPYVIWDTKEDAIKKLKEAGLGTPKIEEAHNEDVATGSVISQSIEVGTQVEEGTVITLVISLGPEAFEIPDVVGKYKDKAENILTSHGLVVNVEYKKDNNVEEDKVISQSVKAGKKVKRGDEITIVVSSGKSTVVVPSVVDKKREDAERILKEAGFKVAVIENYDEYMPKERVISQTPANGTEQVPGATIVIYVSKGNQPVTVYFDANGGKVDKSSKTVYVGKDYKALPTPTRDGYSFVGWSTTKKKVDIVNAYYYVELSYDHTLYAIWSKGTYKLTFNANGGKVSKTSTTVEYGSAYGSLPTPTREYYTFDGWYTSASGGTKVSSSTKMGAKNVTIYAHWRQNDSSDWVLASDVPSGAEILEEKWTYDLVTDIVSKNKSEAGYTLYNTTSEWGAWGSWSGWSNSAVSNSDSRQVETKTIAATYKTQYNYSRWTQYSNGTGRNGPYNQNWSNIYCGYYFERGWSDTPLSVFEVQYSKGNPFNCYGSYNNAWYNETTRQVQVTAAYTQYRYRDRSLIYTYYHRKIEAKESSTKITESSTNTNVKKWVRYRSK